MLLGLIASAVLALQVTSGGEASEWCSADGDRMTMIVYGARAETFTVTNDDPDEVIGPHEWVKVGGRWRRSDLSPRYSSIAPEMVIEGGRLVSSYAGVNGRRETVWEVCVD